jgi:hypothetical protein
MMAATRCRATRVVDSPTGLASHRAARPAKPAGSLAIFERAGQLDPANTGFQRNLSVSYGELADVAAASEDPGSAALIYRRALDFCEGLYGTEHPLTEEIRGRVHEHSKGIDN